ncbi:MAG: hypothetical protein OXH57_05720 [Ekhidna sp.]|nr:hypothetical protein [Ekhidna sp.]
MKTTLTFILIIILTGFVHGQCSYNEIFPVEHGISKFKAITRIASIGNIKEDKQANQYYFARWDKPHYLKGDSVYESSVFYDYTLHPCFKGNENELYLRFVDDKLYKIRITLTFSHAQFEKCMENYNTLVAIFKNEFIDWTQFVRSIRSNDVTKEQIGEGYWFYPTTEENRDKIKLNYLAIGYEVEYEMKWSDYKKEWYRTGNVDKYVIEIKFINLKGTNLTNERY